MSVDAGADGGEVVSKPVVFPGQPAAVNLRAPRGELRAGTVKNQQRAMAEIGFIFGNNLVEKKP